MRTRPILFNGAMVRAILDGRKTQTRRPVKYIPALGEPDGWCFKAKSAQFEQITGGAHRFCPFGVPGERLWVRETWAHDADSLEQLRSETEDVFPGAHGPYYRADETHENAGLTWRPSIHMPRWASRITLEVTSVGIERLQLISAEDAIAEGLSTTWDDGVTYYGPLNHGHCDPRVAFSWLWDSINAKRGCSWASNPWVWVVAFKRSEAIR